MHDPFGGCAPSVLADTARVTRPALGELVRHLEDHGYVTTEPDASDGRGVIVQLTGRGKRAAAAANQAIDDLKRSWAREIGPEKLAAMIDACAALTIRQRAHT